MFYSYLSRSKLFKENRINKKYKKKYLQNFIIKIYNNIKKFINKTGEFV